MSESLDHLAGHHAGHACVVLGNGPSRIGWRRGDQLVIGCNAAYRDTDIDYLVACDTPILVEILESDWAGTLIYRGALEVAQKHARKPHNQLPCYNARMTSHLARGGSGIVALLAAFILGCDPITIIGFDGGLLGAIYDGTPCYPERNSRRIAACDRRIDEAVTEMLKRFPDQRVGVRLPAASALTRLLPIASWYSEPGTPSPETVSGPHRVILPLASTPSGSTRRSTI